MRTVLPLAATVAAVILAIAALLTLTMDRYIVSGTFFVLTAFAIYVRETKN